MQTTDDRPTPHVHDCYQPDRIQRLMTETASISIHAVIISGQPRTYDQMSPCLSAGGQETRPTERTTFIIRNIAAPPDQKPPPWIPK